jgi:hypothetical protein
MCSLKQFDKSPKRHATTRNPTLSTKKRKIRRGESQKMNQGTVFWWGERGLARAGGRAEL